MPKLPKITSLQWLYNILKKEVRYEVDFFHADKNKSVLQVDFNTFGNKVTPTRWYYHHWWAWSSIHSLYLKKEVTDGVDFLHADKHQSFFYKLALLFLMEVAKYVHSNQNRKLLMFLQYL